MTALEIAQFKILFELELILRALFDEVQVAQKNWKTLPRLGRRVSIRIHRYLFHPDYWDNRSVVMIALGITLVPAWFVLAVLYVMEAGA